MNTRSRLRATLIGAAAAVTITAGLGAGQHAAPIDAPSSAHRPSTSTPDPEMEPELEREGVEGIHGTRNPQRGDVSLPASHMERAPLPQDQQAQPRRDGGRIDAPVAARQPVEEHEEEGGATSANAYSTANLRYLGGAVQTAPRVYLVLWGPNWFTGYDPYGSANQLHYFYQGVGGSGWANVLKQYPSNYGTFTNPAAQYKGWIQDTTPVPAQPTRADLEAAVARSAKRMNDYGYNAQYVIATPWGSVDTVSTANSYCAWHATSRAGTTSSLVTFTSLPYGPYMDALGRGCGGKSVNGASGVLDGVTILASHEYAETVNNPLLNAYKDVNGAENGDKCSWLNLSNRKLANGYVFPVQPTWSNTYRTYYGNGCLYSG